MKANCWFDAKDLRVEDVPDPKILDPRDAVVKVTSTAICGSDLHLYDGYIPTMEKGDILGHEFMGEVVEIGPEVKKIKVGDRVVIAFPIACGSCFFCKRTLFSLCENSNPNAAVAEKLWGHSPCGIFGYSHAVGGYAGGQAQYARVPFADVGAFKIESNMTDDQVLFLSDILPTGYMGAEQCDIEPGDTVAVWGCGPVGQFAIKSAYLLGAERVIAIDRFPERLRLASEKGGAVTINYEETPTLETLNQMTGGRGPDKCIDAVGMEAHGTAYLYDKVKQSLMMTTERPIALREAILACRKGGTVSVPGVYGGFADKIPVGAFVNKALTLKSGQTHVQRYMKPLFDRIERGEIDPTFIITHHLPLEDAPNAYKMFRDKEDECIKVVLDPWADGAAKNGNGA
ncbi:MAG: glutathione-dependent formaldehyde dehydrogenase [Verrucomicrobiota bacterium]|nr:glutathione-dependent formaldehyde dehydrogenase [Verrucomicrobiota bacterium]